MGDELIFVFLFSHRCVHLYYLRQMGALLDMLDKLPMNAGDSTHWPWRSLSVLCSYSYVSSCRVQGNEGNPGIVLVLGTAMPS